MNGRELFCTVNLVFFVDTMSTKSPSASSKEVWVEVHPLPCEKADKCSKRVTNEDGNEVVVDFRHEMANAQFSPEARTLKEGFRTMIESEKV